MTEVTKRGAAGLSSRALRGAALALALLVSGCGLFSEQPDETAGWSASKLYTEAKSELNDANYEKAIKYFETLEARYPYGRYATQAQLEIAYAYYKDNETASAIAAADRFIRLHPNHPNVDYAYYLKGLANFKDDLGFVGSLGGADLSERDPKAAREAFDSFKELVTRLPDSKYAPDAAARMKYLVNALAAHEVHVARYYMKRHAYVAAAARAKAAIEQYPQAPAVKDALQVMAEAYDRLGMTDLRDDTRRVMAKNFPADADAAAAQSGKSWWKFW